MVIIVAALLSFVAMQLKPVQENNIKIEKMQNILASVRIESTPKNADELFEQFISTSFVLNENGEEIENVAAFDVDMMAQVSMIEAINKQKSLLTERNISPFTKFVSSFIKSKELDKYQVQSAIEKIKSDRELPVYVCTKEDSSAYYIFPLRGKGLWGPIWGYIALESDFNTVYGAVFDHKGETPGLGAEINQGWFQANFRGKKIFDGNTFKSIEVVKPGTVAVNDFNVDAISGGTITSKGVEAMLFDCLYGYNSFFELKKN